MNQRAAKRARDRGSEVHSRLTGRVSEPYMRINEADGVEALSHACHI